jgi:hypothetical protein
MFVILLVSEISIAQELAFTDVTATAGFANWSRVWQCVSIDFDNDGWTDLLFNRGTYGLPRLFRNNGDGTFTEANELLGPLQNLPISYTVFGDIDNDGDEDILVLLSDNTLGLFENTLHLYLRQPAGFVEATPVELTVPRVVSPGLSARLLDYDRDGDLDILTVEDIAPERRLTLWTNSAQTFSGRVIDTAVTAATTADLDGDLNVDIISSRREDASAPARVWRNDGLGGFSGEVTLAVPAAYYGACPFDCNSDGDLDIYLGAPDWISGPRLLGNAGGMTFSDITHAGMSLGSQYYSSISPADPDRDGDLDYYQNLGAWTNARYFQNDGTGHFSDVSSLYGLAVGGGNTDKAGLWLDFDNDGDLDLFVANTWNADGAWLFRNEIFVNNWLVIKPTARQSNSSLYGCRVEVVSGSSRQVRDFEVGSYHCQSYDRRAHFGLGGAAVAESLIVRWPSGVVDRFIDVAANQTISVIEGASSFHLHVKDVPNDQGGQLRFSWAKQANDSATPPNPVTSYDVQRFVSGWQTIGSLAAAEADSYTVDVATQDILTIGQPAPYSRYRVVARTVNPAVFYESAEDSNYSIDNLPPPAPALTVLDDEVSRSVYATGLHPSDYKETCFYSGQEPGFTPGDAIQCGSSRWYEEMHLRTYYYTARVFDIHGNASEWSNEVTGQYPTDVPGAAITQLRLYPNQPNPFNPRTTIRFDLPVAGQARLSIYDLAGRLVRILVEGEIPAGSHEAVWDGRDESGRAVPSGSYLARLVAGGKVEGVRLSLVR